MRPSVERLTQRQDYLRVSAARHKSVAPGMIVQMLKYDEGRDTEGRDTSETPSHQARMRLGLTVSRKVGPAVARNRARRRLRAVANAVMPQHAKPGRDYVLIGRTATLSRPYAALVADLETALRRLDAYRNAAETSDRTQAEQRTEQQPQNGAAAR